jgi:TRAP-type transport system small permease protein
MKKFYDLVCDAESWIARSFLVLMVVLIFAGGIFRLIGEPINWAIDIATALFAWACFFAADIAWRRNSLMNIEFFTDLLSERFQLVFRNINYAIISAFLVYIFVFGIYLSWISRVRSFQGIPEISYSWVTMSMPVGALLLLITTVLKARADWRGEHVKSAFTDIV